MEKPSFRICQNCNLQGDLSDRFCPHCGQKNTDGRITFSEIWSEFQDAIFNIESRTWRTFRDLFVPGKLTREYFAGRQRRYVHPLRILLVSTVLLILAMNFQDFKSATNHRYDIKEKMVENYERQELFRIINVISDTTKRIYPKNETEIITDTIIEMFRDSINKMHNGLGDGYGDSINMNQYMPIGNSRQELVSKYDFINMDEDELVSKYKKNESFLNRLIFKQKAKFIEDESRLFSTLVGSTTWAILLMMPFVAVVFYLLYSKKKYYYVEHLIFTFHLQSFTFIVLSILIAGMNVFPLWLILALLGIIWIYIYISMKKVYLEGGGKTLFKFILLSLSYLVLFILVTFLTLFTSFLLL